MWFVLSWFPNEEAAPHPKAIKKVCVQVDERTTDDPSKIPVYQELGSPEGWYRDGSNHRVENGHIKRDFDVEAWCLEVNTLQELLNIVTTYGHIEVTDSGGQYKLELSPFD